MEELSQTLTVLDHEPNLKEADGSFWFFNKTEVLKPGKRIQNQNAEASWFEELVTGLAINKVGDSEETMGEREDRTKT